jgi:pimeloyl-ACP methyl ester carboxylesterase
MHNPEQSASAGNYAPVNGLELYYELHGTGEPLVLLHGGMTTIDDFALVLPIFTQSRQVIAYERQGHGHTADIDRAMTLDAMCDDLDELLKHLNIEQADIFGYSMGGSIALAFAQRYPKRVRKLVVASAIFNSNGYYPGIMEGLSHATADQMPSIMREMYEKVAPRPEDWSKLVEKSVTAAADFQGWTPEELREITASTLIIVGDHDIVRTEHAVELYRILPEANLAVLPDTDHVAVLFQHPELLASMITMFLDGGTV